MLEYFMFSNNFWYQSDFIAAYSKIYHWADSITYFDLQRMYFGAKLWILLKFRPLPFSAVAIRNGISGHAVEIHYNLFLPILGFIFGFINSYQNITWLSFFGKESYTGRVIFIQLWTASDKIKIVGRFHFPLLVMHTGLFPYHEQNFNSFLNTKSSYRIFPVQNENIQKLDKIKLLRTETMITT